MKKKTAKITRQQAFNKVYRGLRAQGFEQSKKGAACLYRGPEGRKCAIGWLVTDSEALKGDLPTTGTGVTSQLAVGNFKRLKHLGTDFLSRLQCAHDSAEGPAGVQSNLQVFAENYDLKVPK